MTESVALQALERAELVFWDFDGVIKDSVEVKGRAYERLFEPFGSAVCERVRKHHEAHGGVSRYEKFRTYLLWAGQQATEEAVASLCNRFSELVLQAVIDSPWVPGVREYIEAHRSRQCFVLVTGTPEEEIGQVLAATGIGYCFRETHGAPKAKPAVLGDVLRRLAYSPGRAVAVGDSSTDWEAAKANGVPFILRKTALNAELHLRCADLSFESLDPSHPGSRTS